MARLTGQKVRLLLADDHIMVRQGLRSVLHQEGFEVVGEAADGLEAVKICETFGPDVAVLDISMPVLNGVEAARQIRKARPKTKVILLTMYTGDRFILQSLRAGASGYVLKSKATAELVDAIDAVSRGEIYLSPGVSRTVVMAFLSKTELPSDDLSARERQVLQLIAEGKSTKQIGTILFISAKTVESHRTNIMQKLQIFNVPGLVRYAICQGLVTAEQNLVADEIVPPPITNAYPDLRAAGER